jgi:hypothetical protein
MSRFRLQEMPPWRLPSDYQVVPFELAHYHNYEPGPHDLPQEFKSDVEAALPRWVGKATTIKRGEEIFANGSTRRPNGRTKVHNRAQGNGDGYRRRFKGCR